MNPTALLTVSPYQVARLWGSLVECVHGVNGFGSDTAEVYAYTLLPDNPARHAIAKEHGDRPSFVGAAEIEDAQRAADVLAIILAAFCEDYGGVAFVDGQPFNPDARIPIAPTLHRWHVRIERGPLRGS